MQHLPISGSLLKAPPVPDKARGKLSWVFMASSSKRCSHWTWSSVTLSIGLARVRCRSCLLVRLSLGEAGRMADWKRRSESFTGSVGAI
jgi:hypothetical protein